MFRVLVGDKVIANGLTAAQAHILVGDILERVALPKESREGPGVRLKPKLGTALGVARWRSPCWACDGAVALARGNGDLAASAPPFTMTHR
jgi:hypothetical protein